MLTEKADSAESNCNKVGSMDAFLPCFPSYFQLINDKTICNGFNCNVILY